MWWESATMLFIFGGAICHVFDCQNDPTSEPSEGPVRELQFTWLGALQYIHVKDATPHYFRVPRVVLISRQFVLSTAADAAEVPDGYALGNVVFIDYERDLLDCKLTVEQIAQDVQCDPAVLLVPIADVLLHPEYKNFGVRDSVALLKLNAPLKSRYMLPVCLPLKKLDTEKKERIYYVDFVSVVPRDFLEEEKAVVFLHILPQKTCHSEYELLKVPHMLTDRVVCTDHCLFRSGAPSLVHEHTGQWTILSLAIGGSECPDPLRPKDWPPPARHTLVYPYVSWMTVAITGTAIGTPAKDDPFGNPTFGFMMPRSLSNDYVGSWIGHWWMGGRRCHDRGEQADNIFRFYHEIFQIKPTSFTSISYNVEIKAAHGMKIVCVKVRMPYRLGQPKVWQLNTPAIRLLLPLVTFAHTYKIQVEAWASNDTSGSLRAEIDSIGA